jgi:NADPH:quinone reductase-like Zn-dependent oxidoreductase
MVVCGRIASSYVRPINTTFPLAEAVAAYRYMEENRSIGKIMLTMDKVLPSQS